MRAWYVDRRNEPILDVRMMVSFACALILVLSWLLPREETFRQMLAERQADHVSLAYARLLVALDPDDVELRSLLAAQYLQTGELELAWQVISEGETADARQSTGLLRATILLELAFSQSQADSRTRWENLLALELERASLIPDLDEPAVELLSQAAYAIGQPERAALFFERRFRAGGDQRDLLRAASAWQSADRADRAAELFAGLSAREVSSASAEVVSEALAAFLATGRFDEGFAFIDQAVAQGNDDPTLSVAYVEFAASADRPEQMRRYLREIHSVETLDEDQLARLAIASAASGELEQAGRFYELLLARRPEDLELRERLAEVYGWSGRSEAALEQWLYLAERAGDEASTAAAWRLAQGLYRYETASRLLTELAARRRLTDEEFLALRASYELQGLPDAGIAVIRDYLNAHPEHRLAWPALIELQEHTGDLAGASKSWASFARHHPPDVKERLRWADLLWERYRTEDAVELLLEAENPDRAEYWQRLATYAWFLDDMPLVIRSYLAWMALEELEQDHFDRLLAALVITDSPDSRRLALQAWERFRQPVYLLQALQWAVAARDFELVRSLLETAEQDRALLVGSVEYWEALAYSHQLRGDLPATRATLAEALDYHPARVSLITPYLWVLIETASDDDLAAALERFAPVAEQSSTLWPAYASGFARLNDHRTALAWFSRAAETAPDDLPLLLAYARSLEAGGLGDSAFRLRRHVIGRIAEDRGSTQTSSRTALVEQISEAGRGVLNDQHQQILALQLIGNSDGAYAQAAMPRLYLTQALQREHYSAASYWLHRDVADDVWAQLAVAADQRDRPVLEKLLEHENPLIRVNAAMALDRPEVAYRHAADTSLDDATGLGLARSYYAQYPSGWQIGPESARLSGLNVDSLTLNGAGRVGAYSVGGSVSVFRLSDALRLIPGEVDEWLLEGRAARRNRYGQGRASISLLGSNDELIPGLTAAQTFQLDRRNQLTLGGAYQQLTEITALARAVSQRSGLDLGWQSNLSKRQRLNIRASWDLYESRFGERVGQGTQFEARFDHALKLSGPELLVGASFYTTGNTEEPSGQPLTDRLLVDRGELLLPDSTSRFALNASVARDTPGDLRWQRPSPRYRLGAAVGYQWPENVPTLEFEASVGIRILGNDELSFRTAYTSALLSAVGGDGYRATLIYSRRIGR